MITAPVGSLSGTYDEDDTSTDDTTTDDTTTDDTTTDDGGGSWDAPTATDGFGSWTDSGTVDVTDDSDDSSDDGADYDSGDTTGLGGSFGDDPTEDANTVEGVDDTTAPADSTTGLTNDGTTVNDQNDPADLTDEAADDESYLPGSDTSMEDWRDQTENAPSGVQSDGTGGVPEDYDGTDSEYYEAAGGDNGVSDGENPHFPNEPASENESSPVGDNDIDGDGEAENPFDLSEYDLPNAPDVDLELPDAPQLDVPQLDVPWKVVAGAAVLLGLVAVGPSASTVAAGAGATSALGD